MEGSVRLMLKIMLGAGLPYNREEEKSLVCIYSIKLVMQNIYFVENINIKQLIHLADLQLYPIAGLFIPIHGQLNLITNYMRHDIIGEVVLRLIW